MCIQFRPTLLLFILLLVACKKESRDPKPTSQLRLGFEVLNNINTRIASTEADALLISIKDDQGNDVYSLERFNLIKVGEEYITSSIEIPVGTYTVEEFLVVNEDDSALYLAPKEGSEFAELVSNSLPQAFEVSADEITNINIQVLHVSLGNSAQFGYATFDFDLVKALVFQPGAEGKDAVVSKIVPDNTYPDLEDIHLYAWTHSGELNVNRVFIDFDYNLPSSITVDSAYLQLYWNYSSLFMEGLGLDGHTEDISFYIEKVTEEWNESTITWNSQPATDVDSRILIPDPNNRNQDFLINVTAIFGTAFENDDFHGFMLKYESESPYKATFLASSDHPDEAIRPKLILFYH